MNAEAKEISIHEQSFTVSAPYIEGSVLNAAEARALNQTRAENIANNFRKRVKAALDGVPVKEGEAVPTLADITAAIAEYDAIYNFAMPSPGREPVDPVEREALKIAKQAVKENILAAGKKLKDIPEDKLEAAYAKAAENEEILKEARRRVKAQKSAAASTLADLGL